MYGILTWAARLTAILGIAFIAAFALDVFEPGRAPWEIALALFMHLIPSLVLVGVLAIAWKWPVAGGLMFMALAGLGLLFLDNPAWVNAMLVGPFVAAGLMFVLSGLRPRGRARTRWRGGNGSDAP